MADVEDGLETITGRPKPLFVRTLDELVELLDSVGDRPPVAAGGRVERIAGQLVTARAWSTLELIARRVTG